jgi:hypothetical protein
VHCATNNLPSKVVVREYMTALPNEKRLAAEIAAARKNWRRGVEVFAACSPPKREGD